MKPKEKEIVFRHRRLYEWIKGSLTDEQAKQKIIEEELSKGYVPYRIHFQDRQYAFYHYVADLVKEGEELRQASYYAGYAGKKQARIFYENHKEVIENPPSEIIIKNPMK